MIPLAVLGIAYLLGAIPFGYLLVKWKTGADVRAAGSGNIGATNVMRTTGRAAGGATLAVMAGHAYPVFLGFHGGKAVASFVGAFLCLTPWALAVESIIFVVVVIWTRHISMGSIVGAAPLPLAVWLVMQAPWPAVGASVVAGAFVIYRHSSNIQRLRLGTENVFKF